MGRLNGIGTVHLGVEEDQPDGTRWATYWVTFFFLPLLPLRRERLETYDSHTGGYTYRVVERGSLRPSRLLRTWIFCWLFVPLMVGAPMVLLITEVWQGVLGFEGTAPVSVILAWCAWLGLWVWKLADFHEASLHPERE